MSDSALIIFTKKPELGKVKTRLAKSVGDEAALSIYKKLLVFTKSKVDTLAADKIVYYSNSIADNDLWSGYQKAVQGNGDLGQKMQKAFETELRKYKKVCIIGTDCGDLTHSVLEKAFKLLDQHDFVLGPANDGGYYLLGMKEVYNELFNDIPWSTDQVLKLTQSKIKAIDATVHLLPQLVDVDIIEDWNIVSSNFDI
jgi:rSAM/selenodomain-associated transferase 1